MGRNGSGKSSLLWALQGAGTAVSGTGDGRRRRPGAGAAADARPVGLVPADARPTCSTWTRVGGGVRAGRPRVRAAARARLPRLLDRLVPRHRRRTHHPRDLSEGQRLALVLAIQLAAAPPVVLLDEPTRGLDYPAKRRLAGDPARAGRRRARGASSPPTTSSSSPTSPTGSSCWPRARSSPTARPPTSSSRSPALRAAGRQGSLRPRPWLTVDAGRTALVGAPAGGATR